MSLPMNLTMRPTKVVADAEPEPGGPCENGKSRRSHKMKSDCRCRTGTYEDSCPRMEDKLLGTDLWIGGWGWGDFQKVRGVKASQHKPIIPTNYFSKNAPPTPP